jgi:hypothetical protein
VFDLTRLEDLEGLLEAAGVRIIPPMLSQGVELLLAAFLGGISFPLVVVRSRFNRSEDLE